MLPVAPFSPDSPIATRDTNVIQRPKALHDNSPSNKAANALMMGGLPSDVVDDLSCIANKDWVEEQNFPLLHLIVLELHGKDLEQALAENPGEVDREDAMGRTALNWAAARGDDRSLATLLRYGADPNILDCQFSGPLSYAAEKNHTLCVSMLLKAGALPDPVIPGSQRVGSPLNCATRNASDPKLISALLNYGADVEASGVDGRTPLMHAARTNKNEFVRLLLVDYKANRYAVSAAGETPLSIAITNNSNRALVHLCYLVSRFSAWSPSHLLALAAQFANVRTMTILCAVQCIEVKDGSNFDTRPFEKILRQRHDWSERLEHAFQQLINIIREGRCEDEVSSHLLLRYFDHIPV